MRKVGSIYLSDKSDRANVSTKKIGKQFSDVNAADLQGIEETGPIFGVPFSLKKKDAQSENERAQDEKLIDAIRFRKQIENVMNQKLGIADNSLHKNKLTNINQAGGADLARLMQGMQRGPGVDSEAFFTKVITADKGMTFDNKGNPLLYRKPKLREKEADISY